MADQNTGYFGDGFQADANNMTFVGFDQSKLFTVKRQRQQNQKIKIPEAIPAVKASDKKKLEKDLGVSVKVRTIPQIQKASSSNTKRHHSVQP